MFVSKIPWIILLIVWMLGATWWHVCTIKQLCLNDAQPVVVSTDQETRLPAIPRAGLTIADGDRFRLALPGNFSFARSGANANMNTLMGMPDSLTAYLKGNPGRTLTITGYYATSEKNETPLANLGLARAEGVKQYLVQQGIPAASLTTAGEVHAEGASEANFTFTPTGDSLYGGVGFAFGGVVTPVASPTADTTADALLSDSLPLTEEGLAAAEKYTSVFEPMDLYFLLNKSDYIKTPETTKFFDEAEKYLTTHKDKKLLLTGHTDNSGPDATNRRLSRERANEVGVRLRRSGIDKSQIAVEAKGESAPKASNDTREGRKANRRVTVVIR